MHVAYLCLQPRSGTGAADTHVDGIVGGLRQLGVEVDLIELRTSSESLVVRLLLGLLLQVRHVRRLRAADVVYARMHPTAALLPWLLGRTPYVVEVNGVPEDYVVAHPRLRRAAGLVRRGIRRLLARADHVIVVTPGLGQRVHEWVPDARTTVVPNAADPDVWRPDLPRPDDVPEGRYAIFFGALAPWQGLDLAIQAAQHPDWPEDLRLVIVGDGPERHLAERASAEAPDRIVYLGARAKGEMPGYVANAEVSLCLKRYHDPVAGQSPLKLYESLVSGTPVLATPLHGCTDAGHSTRQVTVIAPTPQDLSRALAESNTHPLDEPSAQLASISRARRHEAWSARARSIETLLNRAQTTNPPRTL